MITTAAELYARATTAVDAHDNSITDDEFGYWATQETYALSLFAARLGWTQNVSTQTFTVTGSESGGNFVLTNSPLCILCVHQIRSRLAKPLKLNNAVDFLRELPGTPFQRGEPEEYRVLYDATNDDVVLNFYPAPNAGTVLVVSYVPEPSKVTLAASPPAGSANTVSFPLGWEERIVLGIARRALVKEGSDTSEILRMIAECDSLIESAVYDRVLADHPTVRNLDHERRGWSSSVRYPSPAEYWWR